MLKVLNKNREMSNAEIYRMTRNQTNEKMSDYKGEIVTIVDWVEYEDVSENDGEIRRLLSVKTDDGRVLVTNSATFRRELFYMLEIFGNEPLPPVKIVGGTSKGGREFITAALA